MAAWPAAVGEEIARNAWPARFQRDGTLVVHARDAIWAFELTQRAGEIEKRLDGVSGLKFVPGPLPEASLDDDVTPTSAAAVASPEQRRRAHEWTKDIADEELRKLVRKAAESSLARNPNDRSF